RRRKIARREIVQEDALAVAHGGARNENFVAEPPGTREVALDVPSGQESGHADPAAEEVVRHGGDPNALRYRKRGQQRDQARREHLPGHHGHVTSARARAQPSDTAAYPVLEPSHEPD